MASKKKKMTLISQDGTSQEIEVAKSSLKGNHATDSQLGRTKKETVGEALVNGVKKATKVLTTPIVDAANIVKATQKASLDTTKQLVEKAQGKNKTSVGNILLNNAGTVTDALGDSKTLSTASGIATNMGKGALKTVEGVSDTAKDLIANPIEQKLTYGYDYLTKGKKVAEENLEDLKKQQEEDIKKDSTQSFLNSVGYDEDFQDKMEKNSLVKENNLGGKILQGVGGMVPSLVMGAAIKGPQLATESLKGLKGTELAKTALANVGKSVANNAAANTILGASSYGSGLEEAYNNGATQNQARLYGLGNAATEFGTEMLTGGIPGLESSTGVFDNALDKGIDTLTKNISSDSLKALAKGGLKLGKTFAGEGLEEAASEIINPYLKNATYSSGEKVDWNNVLQSGLVGGLTGIALGGAGDITDTVSEYNENKLAKMQKQAQEIQTKVQNGEITEQQASEQLKQVQQGTYEKNQAIDKTAQEQMQNIQQQVQQGTLDVNEANNQIKALNQTIEQQRNTINQANEIQQGGVNNESSNNNNTDSNVNDTNTNQVTNEETKKEYRNVDEVNQIADTLNTRQKQALLNELLNNEEYRNNLETNKNVNTEELIKKLQQDTNIKHVDLVDKTSYDSIKKEYAIAKKNLDNFDSTELDNSLKNISANKQGKRTKQQWLDVAENLGSNISNMSSAELEQYAIQSWMETKPNGKDSLNRQGQKYVKFSIDEWLNSVYKGAGVGTQNKANLDTNTQEQANIQDTQESALNGVKNGVTEEINANKEEDVIKIKPSTTESVTEQFMKSQKGEIGDRELRNWVETSNVATNNENLINQADIDKITYEVQSNKKTFEKATKNLEGLTYEQKVDRPSQLLNSDKKITATDITEAQIALREAATKGDIKSYLNLQQDIAIMGTELGQATQALSMIQKMTPDGQLATLNKIVNRQQKLGNKAWENVELNPEKVQKVLDAYDDETHTTYNKEKMDQAVDELKQDIADQLDVSVSDKVNAWRYLSMLGNPKTHIRNIVANVAMSVVKKAKDKVNAAGQDLFIKDKANKTTTLKSTSKEVKNLTNQIANEVYQTENTSKYNEKNDIESKAKTFNNKALNTLYEFNSKALEVEDTIFKKANFKESMNRYLTAQGISTQADIESNPQIIENAKQFAIEEAKIATFNQDNKLSSYINKLDNLGTIGKVARGAIIPFTRTPLNIAKTGIEYTPGVGLATTISDVKKAPSNMKGTVLIDGLSKQVVGSGLALLGYALAKSGYVTADSGDDKDDSFEKDQGAKMDYSIKIGDKSYDLSWLSPSTMPFFVGAAMFENFDKAEGLNENVIIEALASTLDPLSEMSCISSFTDILNSYSSSGMGMFKDIGESTAQNYISQFVPTVSSQFAKLFDNTKRSTYADKSSGNTFTQETVRQLMYKIPGLRNMLPEQTDYYGNTKKETDTDNKVIQALNAFLNPANTKTDTTSKTSKELLDLYNKTGNSDIIPSALYQYVDYNNESYKMTTKEYNSYKKTYGTAFNESVSALMNTSSYKKASDEDKAEMISGLASYAKDKAKDEYLASKGIDYSSTSDKVDSIIGNSMSVTDYYSYKTTAPNIVSGTAEQQQKKIALVDAFDLNTSEYNKYLDEIGDIKGTNRKQKVKQYINSLNLTATQKAMLYKMNYSSYKSSDSAIQNTINNSDLSATQKNTLSQWILK